MKRIYLTATLALGAIVLTAGIAWAVWAWVVKDKTEVGTAPNLSPVVTAQDNITGLYPGGSQPYKVTIQNRNPYAIQVTYLEGYNPKTASTCQDHVVTIDKDDHKSWKGLAVPPRATVTIKTKVIMKTWAKESCSGRALPFEVTVHASSK